MVARKKLLLVAAFLDPLYQIMVMMVKNGNDPLDQIMEYLQKLFQKYILYYSLKSLYQSKSFTSKSQILKRLLITSQPHI